MFYIKNLKMKRIYDETWSAYSTFKHLTQRNDHRRAMRWWKFVRFFLYFFFSLSDQSNQFAPRRENKEHEGTELEIKKKNIIRK